MYQWRYSFALLFALSSVDLARAPLAESTEAAPKDVNLFETVSVLGTHLPVNAVPSSFDVIDGETIDAHHSQNVSELLRHIVGVDVSRPGGAGAAELFLRGAESNFTTVLVDGVRVNNLANSRGGSYDFAALDVGQVERIEIIRGPVSAVYGADALSGVINIVTHEPRESQAVTLGGEAGVQGYSRAYARASAPHSDRWSSSVFAAHSNAPEDVEGYSARVNAFQGGFHYSNKDRSGHLRMRYGDIQQTAFPDASGGPLYAVSRELQRLDGKEWESSVEVRQRMSSRWTAQLSGSLFHRQDIGMTPAIFASSVAVTPQADGGSRFHAQHVTFNNQTVIGRLYLAGGSEVRREAGRQSSLLRFESFEMPASSNLERRIYSGFGEGRYATPWGVEIFAGARWDRPDEFDSRASKRLALSYTHAITGMRVHVGWSDGFKLPSLYALGDSLVGNPALREEEAVATEIGVELPFDNQKIILGLTGYVSQYRSLIDFDFATFRLVNRSHATIRGGEGKLSIAPRDDVQFDVHVGYTDIDVGGEAASLPLRPKWRGGIAAVWRPDSQWTLHTSVMSVGTRRASSIPTGDITLSRYTRIDLAVTRKIREVYRLRFAVDNAQNERYQEDAGVPSPGIIVRIGGEVCF